MRAGLCEVESVTRRLREVRLSRQSLAKGCQKSIRCARHLFSKVNTVTCDGLKTVRHFLLSGVVCTKLREVRVCVSGLVGSTEFHSWEAAREQQMLKGHLPRVMYHRVYFSIRRLQEGCEKCVLQDGREKREYFKKVASSETVREVTGTGCVLGAGGCKQ